jgi:hypothetical protein
MHEGNKKKQKNWIISSIFVSPYTDTLWNAEASWNSSEKLVIGSQVCMYLSKSLGLHFSNSFR